MNYAEHNANDFIGSVKWTWQIWMKITVQVLVHVSTTYNNLEKVSLEEVIYKTSISTEALFKIVDTLEEDAVTSATKT